MKHLLLALLLVTFSSALADTPAKIAEDYQKAAAAALTKINTMLESATTTLIAKLVSSGDTAAAAQLTTQLKAKMAGEPVPAPHASATLLFAQYDQARARALEPAQKASIARIEGMLKTGGGTKLETVTELGKVRAEIEGVAAASPGPSSSLDKAKIPKVWGYYLSSKYDTRYGTLRLNDDGTMAIEAANPVHGTWLKTPDPSIISVSMKNASNVEEKTETIFVNGAEATMQRLSGTKYLKAD